MQSHKDGMEPCSLATAQQMLPEFVRSGKRRILFRENVRHKFGFSPIRDGDGCGKINARVLIENATDLIQFDSLSTDLRLPVEAPAKFELPSGRRTPRSPVRYIRRTWHSCKRIRQEAALGKIRAGCDIPARQRCHQCKFRLPFHQEPVAMFIQQINAGAGDRETDGWRSVCPGFEHRPCGNHGAFRGSIMIDDSKGS